MIPSALSIDDIAKRLGGDVLTRNMARVPAPKADANDRSLMVLKLAAGLVVVPKAKSNDFRERDALKVAAEAHVAETLAQNSEKTAGRGPTDAMQNVSAMSQSPHFSHSRNGDVLSKVEGK